jgi:hypothetical protein
MIDPKIIEQVQARIRASKTKKRGLGDMVADGLAAIGITKERVSKALGKPCGCSKRQQKLNELGRQFGIG